MVDVRLIILVREEFMWESKAVRSDIFIMAPMEKVA